MTTDTKEITLDTTISQSLAVVGTDLDGETVLMNIEAGNYYGFNPVLSRIWTLIEVPTQVSEIVEQLLNEYEVSREQAETEVLNVLNELKANQLLELQ